MVIALTRINRRYMPKFVHYSIDAFPYFAMDVEIMNFFELWGLIIEYVWFFNF
jgi:hypothetical protein